MVDELLQVRVVGAAGHACVWRRSKATHARLPRPPVGPCRPPAPFRALMPPHASSPPPRQDSFLRRLSGQFFQMLHEERPRVAPDMAEQVGAAALFVFDNKSAVRWRCLCACVAACAPTARGAPMMLALPRLLLSSLRPWLPG